MARLAKPRRAALPLLAVALITSGCASVTPSDLEREDLGSSFVQEIDAPPETAYRQLVGKAKRCYYSHAFRIDSDYFPTVQQGRVVVGTTAVTAALAVADLRPNGQGGTQMTVRYYDPHKRASRADEWRKSFVPWASGKPGECALDAIRIKPPSQ